MLALATNTILIPLALGLLLGLVAPKLGRAEAAVYGVAVLAVYILLEGFPAFPPVAGKQKLAYLLLAAIPLAYLPRPRIILPLFVIAATAWLGWPKLSASTMGASALLLLAPAVVLLLPKRQAPFLIPACAIIFAIGAAILSVLGVFMGFAQAMGAEAALLGGILAVAYIRGLITGRMLATTPQTERLAVMTLTATSLMVALFAPDISLPAYAVLSLCLAVPAIAPAFASQSHALRPFLFALLAAVPALIATALAFATTH